MNDKRDYADDTIVAPATPPGSGGIAIVRVSGGETEKIARTLLGNLPPPRTAVLRQFRNAAVPFSFDKWSVEADAKLRIGRRFRTPPARPAL